MIATKLFILLFRVFVEFLQQGSFFYIVPFSCNILLSRPLTRDIIICRYICCIYRDRWHIIGDNFRIRALNNTRERNTGRDILYRQREREREYTRAL